MTYNTDILTPSIKVVNYLVYKNIIQCGFGVRYFSVMNHPIQQRVFVYLAVGCDDHYFIHLSTLSNEDRAYICNLFEHYYNFIK